MYDLIGDIHGHHDALTDLLEQMGYRRTAGIWSHPTRKAIFVGDLIDRGPQQREVVETVRAMVDGGHALMVMGNHEFNAVAYHKTGPDGRPLRPHSEKNRGQHAAFLEAYEGKPADHADVIEWFAQLPLWLDLGELRVIHACWDEAQMARARPFLDERQALLPDAWEAACHHGSELHGAIEVLLKGPEHPLPPHASYLDKDGNLRDAVRLAWWKSGDVPLADLAIVSSDVRRTLPQTTIRSRPVGSEGPPLFFGHYWMQGQPRVLSDNAVCLDYSIAKKGKLVAYRWDGQPLHEGGFVSATSTSQVG